MVAPVSTKPLWWRHHVRAGSKAAHFAWSAAAKRDAYIAFVFLTAASLFAYVGTNPTTEPWDPLAVLALFAAMVVAERVAVPLPRDAAVSVATIPHIVALLLLPAWLTMALSGGSMLVDQLFARAAGRKLVFNVASVALTTGVTAILADKLGLSRDHLAVADWRHMPAFLLVAFAYYTLTNSLVAIVLSLSGQKPAPRVFVDNAKFVLPAEFAVCGIGGLVTIVWLLNPAWTPLVLFPAIVSQVAYMYVSSSKHHQHRLAFIAEASRVLGLSLDRQELAERCVRLCVPELGEVALLWLIEDDNSLSLAAHAVADGHGDSACVEPEATSPLASWAMRLARRTAIDERTAVWPATEIVEHGPVTSVTSFRSALAAVVRSVDHKFGVLIVLSMSSGASVSRDGSVLEELAQRCAAGLANAYLHAEAQRATRVRDDFLSVAAHELKTPVTSLRGYAQLLQKSANSPPGVLAKGLRTIEAQSDRLTELTGKLLDVSRIDSGKLRLETRPTDLAALVRNAVMQIQDTTDQHTLQFMTSGPCEARLDPLRIEQVVANLVANAIKYSPNGGPIEIAVERVGSDTVRFHVRDYGLGIPPERRGRLFDRMYQAHGDGYLSGLGLGLFISKQIVELHGGSIEAHFPADGGTCMKVSLPIEGPGAVADAVVAR